jgi:hypothetical protein
MSCNTCKLNGKNVATTDSSHTITHETNIIDFTPDRIGCFAQSTGELADVYGADFTPTLTRPCDAIVKVRPSTTLNTAILGIIVDDHTFASHGDVLATVIQGPTYEIGQLLVPDESGLCRIATEQEKRTITFEGLPRVRITGLVAGAEFVLAFMS